MNDIASPTAEDEQLEARVSRFHLRQRLGIESEKEARIFGQGFNFFHLENWYSAHAVIRGVLRLAGLLGRGRRNALRIEVRRNDLELPGLPPCFDGYVLLQLSDLHLDMNADMPGALMSALQGLDYDVAVITGDVRAKTVGPFEPAVDALRRVRVHLQDPVYAVLGNHDSLRMVPGIEALGIRLLLNESVALRRGAEALYLAGVDDPHYFGTHNLEKAAEGIPANAPSVLLAHSPEIYKHAAHAGFSAMLCGHTHGGQICLPGGLPLLYNARCPRRYCRGPWRHGAMSGYTSVGSGVSMVDVRLNCRPEITLHRLRAARGPR